MFQAMKPRSWVGELKWLCAILFCLPVAACQSRVTLPADSATRAFADQPHVGRTIVLTPDSPSLESLLEPGEVALTFDDGPDRVRTPKVLQILADSRIRAAFFLRGDQAVQYPDLVLRMVSEGHAVGSHTYSHPRLVEMVPEAAKADIEQGRDAISDALGTMPHTSASSLFRYTYLQSNEVLDQIVDDLGLIVVGANAFGRDWENLNPDAVLRNIEMDLERNGRSGVILLHDPVANSEGNVELVIRELKAAGYKFVSFKADSREGSANHP